MEQLAVEVEVEVAVEAVEAVETLAPSEVPEAVGGAGD